MVKKFVKVFSEDLPGLPPNQAITFEIELLTETTNFEGTISNGT